MKELGPRDNPLSVDDYLAASVEIDDVDLDEEFTRVAADLAYWGAQYASAVRLHLRAKIDAKKERAKAYIMHRESIFAEGGKPTEKQVEAACDVDDDVLHAAYAEVDAEAERARLRIMVDAVSAKKDALQSLGAKLRKEMDANPSVRREQRGFRGDRDY